MSYSFTSYSQTTTVTSENGKKSTQTVTSTTSLGGDQSSLLIREVSENELPGLAIESTEDYEISDNEGLTIHDFYALMNSEDEEDESNSDSDVEDYWFPSLLNNSIIQLLDDKEEYEDNAISSTPFLIEEGSSELDEDEEEEEHIIPERRGKRHYQRHSNKNNKRFRKSEQVPIDIINISLQ